MIISASRRTDIPAYYSEWFLNRIQDGYTVYTNPHNSNDITRVSLSPDVVDCIVFRTKNPLPLIPRLGELADYKYFFQYTISPYGKAMETNLPSFDERIEAFRTLSKMIGPERMVWRYDPVFISPKYDIDFHRRGFEYLAERLAPYAHSCMIGFIIMHPFVSKRIDSKSVKHKNIDDIRSVAAMMSSVALRHKLRITTCAESADLEEFGITHGACVGREHIESIVGYKFDKVKENYLRAGCRCMESIDIGNYNTCLNGCLYCYATINKPRLHGDPLSPSLDPNFNPNKLDQPKSLVCKSHRMVQEQLF